jgi:signal peptidase I
MIFRYAASVLALVLTTALLLRATVFTSVVMSGDAMEPTILPGEYLIATKGRATEPHRGAVVLLDCPAPIGRACLKRVVAIAGDRVDVRRNRLLVNEIPVEPPVTFAVDLDPLIIPPESVFVLSDLRSDPEDSRHWGPLKVDAMEGQARVIWLSLDWFADGTEVRTWPRVRWDRILRTIR